MSTLETIVLLICLATAIYGIVFNTKQEKKKSEQLYEIYNNLEAIHNIIEELKPEKAQDCGGITGGPSLECYECKHGNLCKEIYIAKTKLINLNTILD